MSDWFNFKCLFYRLLLSILNTNLSLSNLLVVVIISRTAKFCETREKRIFFSENKRIGNSYPERYRKKNARSFYRPQMTKRITSLE